MKSHHEQLLLRLQKDLESQKDQVSKAQQDLRIQREQVKAFRVYSFIIITPAAALSHLLGQTLESFSISLCSSEPERSG